MKLLYCQDCGDIIAPHPVPRLPRKCRCGHHSVWWENPAAGILRVHDEAQPPNDPRPSAPRAWVLGITNLFLGFPGRITADDVQMIIDAHKDSYLFKRLRSCILRIRPGESGDTAWAELPSEVNENG